MPVWCNIVQLNLAQAVIKSFPVSKVEQKTANKFCEGWLIRIKDTGEKKSDKFRWKQVLFITVDL